MQTHFLGAFAMLTAVSTSTPAAESSAHHAVVFETTLPPNLLGTVAIPIRAERFVTNLARARKDDRLNSRLQGLIAPARRMSKQQQLTFVQKVVHDQISWMSDATLWGQHDYWASASETLVHGAGDSEDRAILKMQALIALGFSRQDLFITLARDQVDGPAVLLAARFGGRYLFLDDSGAAPFDSERRRVELQPAMRFSMAGAWLHANATPSRIVAVSVGK